MQYTKRLYIADKVILTPPRHLHPMLIAIVIEVLHLKGKQVLFFFSLCEIDCGVRELFF